MTLPNTLSGLIIRDPQSHHGQPTIVGTGVAVRTIVGHYKLGLSAEDIAAEMSLDLAAVYAALTYYHLNREEIEADITANAEEFVKNPLTS